MARIHTAHPLTVSLTLAALPAFYVIVTGGGDYMGFGNRVMARMPEWFFWAVRVASLGSAIVTFVGVWWAGVALRSASGRTRTAVWVVVWGTVACGLVAMMDIMAGITM